LSLKTQCCRFRRHCRWCGRGFTAHHGDSFSERELTSR